MSDAEVPSSGPEGPWDSAAASAIESAAERLAHELADQLGMNIDVAITANRGEETEISIAMSALPTGSA